MSLSVYELVRHAIIEKKIVVATYKRRRREMCPHTLGSTNGKKQALFYQFAGDSERGLGPDGSDENWRCITLINLRDVELVEGEWHTGSGHSQPQTCVKRIDVEVAY